MFALFLDDLVNVNKNIDDHKFRLMSEYNTPLWELYKETVIYNYSYFKYHK